MQTSILNIAIESQWINKYANKKQCNCNTRKRNKKSSQIYLYNALDNTHCFKAAFQKNITILHNFVSFRRLELGDNMLHDMNNQAVVICYIVYNVSALYVYGKSWTFQLYK